MKGVIFKHFIMNAEQLEVDLIYTGPSLAFLKADRMAYNDRFS